MQPESIPKHKADFLEKNGQRYFSQLSSKLRVTLKSSVQKIKTALRKFRNSKYVYVNF